MLLVFLVMLSSGYLVAHFGSDVYALFTDFGDFDQATQVIKRQNIHVFKFYLSNLPVYRYNTCAFVHHYQHINSLIIMKHDDRVLHVAMIASTATIMTGIKLLHSESQH